jgi:hypothetical protein
MWLNLRSNSQANSLSDSEETILSLKTARSCSQKRSLAAILNEMNPINNLNSRFFNPLKPNHSPLYVKTQSVPRCKHFSSRL